MSTEQPLAGKGPRMFGLVIKDSSGKESGEQEREALAGLPEDPH